MLIRNSVGLAIISCIVIGASPMAFAKPKPGSGGGQCTCMCVAPSGIGGILVANNTYNSMGYPCGAFEGKTCNMNNPNTGGIATGELMGCDSAKASGRAAVLVTPFGAQRMYSPRVQ